VTDIGTRGHVSGKTTTVDRDNRAARKCVQRQRLCIEPTYQAESGYFDSPAIPDNDASHGGVPKPPQNSAPDKGGHSETKSGKHQTGGNGNGGETLPEWKWRFGVVIYTITNVGFLKLFDFCAGCPEIPIVLQAMGVYYFFALMLRVFMHQVLGLDKSFAQFWWEGVPKKQNGGKS
jgi:hypothetical protein